MTLESKPPVFDSSILYTLKSVFILLSLIKTLKLYEHSDHKSKLDTFCIDLEDIIHHIISSRLYLSSSSSSNVELRVSSQSNPADSSFSTSLLQSSPTNCNESENIVFELLVLLLYNRISSNTIDFKGLENVSLGKFDFYLTKSMLPRDSAIFSELDTSFADRADILVIIRAFSSIISMCSVFQPNVSYFVIYIYSLFYSLN